MLVFSKDANSKLGAVFRSSLNSAASHGATEFQLPSGDGSLLPALAGGNTLILRFGTDAEFEEVICTAISGDMVTCQPIQAPLWPFGTPIIATVSAAMLRALVQREELGNASGLNVGTTAGTVASGDDSRFTLPTKLQALNNLTWAADKLVYLTGAYTAAVASLSAFVRGLLGSADAASFRSGIGLGDAATKNVGVASSEVAAGDHTHATLASANVCFVRQASDNTHLANLVMAANTAFTFSVGNRITNLLLYKDYDPDNNFSTSTGTYTVPVTGLYKIQLSVNSNMSTNEYGDLNIIKNYTTAIGNPIVLRAVSVSGHSWYAFGIAIATVSLVAGDTISIHGSYTTNPAQAVSMIRAALDIQRIA